MPVESAADRLAFLSAGTFGETATYTPSGGSPAPGIPGIFNEAFLSDIARDSDGPTANDTQPTFTCRAADLPAGAVGGDAGDTLALAATETHPAVTYRVAEIRPDGAGMALLILAAHP